MAAVLALISGEEGEGERGNVEPPAKAEAVSMDVKPEPDSARAPPSQPVIRACEEIRASSNYASQEEQAYFIANCLGSANAGRQEQAPTQVKVDGGGPVPQIDVARLPDVAGRR